MDYRTYDFDIGIFSGDGSMACHAPVFIWFLSQQCLGVDFVVGYRHFIGQPISSGSQPIHRRNLRPPRPPRHRLTHHPKRICLVSKEDMKRRKSRRKVNISKPAPLSVLWQLADFTTVVPKRSWFVISYSSTFSSLIRATLTIFVSLSRPISFTPEVTLPISLIS